MSEEARPSHDGGRELEELVFHCLEASDPEAELERRTGDRTELAARARRVIERVRASERRQDGAPTGSASDPAMPEADSVFHREEERREKRSSFASPRRAGDELGEFHLIELLGQGGMGQVWLAEQRSLSRRVALKLVRPEVVSERSLALFAREARAGGRLSHPGIVAVHAHGETDGVAWIAMELVEGACTLRHALDELGREGELPEGYYGKVAELAARIADAMHAAHEAGVIHRDLKPQNVLVTPDERPKIADFGLARLTNEAALSLTGDLTGTYLYMSPEQVAARRMGIDHRTDVFSLGVVLYEMLTLRRPFDGDTSQQVVQQILTKEPPDPRAVRSKVPRDLAVICGKCLEKDRDRRYSTMEELAEDLRRFLAREPIQARPPSTWQRARMWARRHRTLALTGGTIIVSLVVASGLLLALLGANSRLEENGRTLAEAKTALELRGEELDRTNQQLTESEDTTLREYYRSSLRASKLLAELGRTDFARGSLRMAPELFRDPAWSHLARGFDLRLDIDVCRDPFGGDSPADASADSIAITGLDLDATGRFALVGTAQGRAFLYPLRFFPVPGRAELVPGPTAEADLGAVGAVRITEDELIVVWAGKVVSVGRYDRDRTLEALDDAFGLPSEAGPQTPDRWETFEYEANAVFVDEAGTRLVLRTEGLAPGLHSCVAIDLASGARDERILFTDVLDLDSAGSSVALSRGEGAIEIVDLESGGSGRFVDELPFSCSLISFGSTDLFAAAPDGRVLRIERDADRWHLSYSFDGPELSALHALDSGELIAGNADGDVVLVSQSGDQTTYASESPAITHVDASDDGLTFAGASSDGHFHVWDRDYSRPWLVLDTGIMERAQPFSDVEGSSDGRLVVTADEGSYWPAIRFWDLRLGSLVACINSEGGRIADLDWAAEADILASVETGGTCTVWDVSGLRDPDLGPEGLRRIASWKISEAAKVRAISLSPDGTRILIGIRNEPLCIRDVRTGREEWRGTHEMLRVAHVEWSPDGRTVLASGSRVMVVDVESGETRELGRRSDFASFSKDGEVYLVEDGARLALRSSGGELLRDWDLPDGWSSVAVSRDGRLIACQVGSLADGSARVVLVNPRLTEQLDLTWDRPIGRIWCNADGSVLLAASSTKTAFKCWELTEGGSSAMREAFARRDARQLEQEAGLLILRPATGIRGIRDSGGLTEDRVALVRQLDAPPEVKNRAIQLVRFDADTPDWVNLWNHPYLFWDAATPEHHRMALRAYEWAILREPNRLVLAAMLACAAYRCGELSRAIEAFEQAEDLGLEARAARAWKDLATDGEDPSELPTVRGLAQRARRLLDQGDAAAARSHVEQLVEVVRRIQEAERSPFTNWDD